MKNEIKLTKEQKQLIIWSMQKTIAELESEMCKLTILHETWLFNAKQIDDLKKLVKGLKAAK